MKELIREMDGMSTYTGLADLMRRLQAKLNEIATADGLGNHQPYQAAIEGMTEQEIYRLRRMLNTGLKAATDNRSKTQTGWGGK